MQPRSISTLRVRAVAGHLLRGGLALALALTALGCARKIPDAPTAARTFAGAELRDPPHLAVAAVTSTRSQVGRLDVRADAVLGVHAPQLAPDAWPKTGWQRATHVVTLPAGDGRVTVTATFAYARGAVADITLSVEADVGDPKGQLDLILAPLRGTGDAAAPGGFARVRYRIQADLGTGATQSRAFVIEGTGQVTEGDDALPADVRPGPVSP